ncbi:MAG TPA: hypothetical protein VME46_07910 [Acidimicrobiales bacterium]|nr:hypothetical protein [Acidimicrobiales bacterium]
MGTRRVPGLGPDVAGRRRRDKIVGFRAPGLACPRRLWAGTTAVVAALLASTAALMAAGSGPVAYGAPTIRARPSHAANASTTSSTLPGALGTTTTSPAPTTTTSPVTSSSVPATTSSTSPGAHAGYWVVRANGSVSAFGLPSYGDLSQVNVSEPVVGAAATPGAGGYWLVTANGGVYAFGDAKFYGSAGSVRLNKQIVAMAATPDGGGYWLVASDGGIFGYGDARYYGSTGAEHLNKPIVGIAPTPDGQGYWLVASDGGIFGYGDAKFYGSAGATHLNRPIVAIAATADGRGYWLVASDGGLFAYGDARFHGSAAGQSVASPVTAMAATPDGQGYWLAEAGGKVLAYGDALPLGSAPAAAASAPVVAIVAAPSTTATPPATTTTSTPPATTTTTAPRTTTTRPRTTTTRATTTTTRATTTTARATTTTSRPRPTTTRPSRPTTTRPTRPTTTRPSRPTTTTTRPTTTTTLPTTTTTAPGTSPGHPYAAKARGYDVSWPQCLPLGSERIQALPAEPSFAIVGVNNGVIDGFNSCFNKEAHWAGKNLSVYIILQAAPGGRPTFELTGPKATCARTSNPCRGYDWGFNYARSDVAFVKAQGLNPRIWWLDIEEAEQWPTDRTSQQVNAQIIQGALDALRRSGHVAGIYSTWYQWGQITGSYVPTGDNVIWVAGATTLSGNSHSAQAYCQRALSPGDPGTLSSSSIGFADGIPWLVQYGYRSGVPRPIDPDYSCG